MKKLVLKMMAVCAGALIVSCGSGKNMLSVSSLDGEWNIFSRMKPVFRH